MPNLFVFLLAFHGQPQKTRVTGRVITKYNSEGRDPVLHVCRRLDERKRVCTVTRSKMISWLILMNEHWKGKHNEGREQASRQHARSLVFPHSNVIHHTYTNSMSSPDTHHGAPAQMAETVRNPWRKKKCSAEKNRLDDNNGHLQELWKIHLYPPQ